MNIILENAYSVLGVKGLKCQPSQGALFGFLSQLVPSNECNFSNATRNERTSHFCKELSCQVILTYMRILLDLFRNVNYHILQRMQAADQSFVWTFLLFLSLKTKKKLQQANMTANESMQRLKTG